MKRNTSNALFVLLVFFAGQACEETSPGEGVPAYIYIADVQFEAGAGQGSSSADISEVWVTAGNQALGAYDIPSRVPVLTNSETEIRLEGGIRENGINQNPIPWEFFGDDIRSINLVPTETDTVSVQLGYAPGTQFAFIEDFESPNIEFGTIFIGEPQHAMQRTQEEVFEGDFSGLIELDTQQTIVSLLTTQAYTGLNAVNPRVYLELNYLSDVPVVFGVAVPGSISGQPETFFEAGFNPSSSWKKIYLSLGQAILNSRADSYQIVLEAFATSIDNFGDDGKARVYLDNMKLVHF